MGSNKQKQKSTREPQLSANSSAAKKRAKQDVVHRMVVTSLESKTRGCVYGNVKKIIDDAIAVSPWMTEDSLKCAARRHKHKISNNQLLDKEEASVWLWIFLVATPIQLGFQAAIGLFLLPHSFFNLSFNICGMHILLSSIVIRPTCIYYHSFLPT